MRDLARLLTAVVLAAGLSGPAPADDTAPQRSETISDYRARMQARYTALRREQVEQEQAEAAAPTSLAVPEGGFADRVNDAISDFLPLFQFAVNAVSTSEDNKSITVNFNPIRKGRHLFSLQTTVTEPEVSMELSDALVESARVAERERIEDGLGDFEDLNTALTYGYQSDLSICKRDGAVVAQCDWQDVRSGGLKRAWGRDPRIYDHLVDRIFAEALLEALPSSSPSAFAAYADKLAAISQSLGEELQESTLTFGELEDKIAAHNAGIASGGSGETIDATIDDLATLIVADEDEFREYQEQVHAFGLDRISDMILSQPLLTGTAHWRDREQFIGANEWGATLRLEWGRSNFNHLMKLYRRMVAEDPNKKVVDALKQANDDAGLFSADRFALSITYKEIDGLDYIYDYVESVTDPGSGAVNTFDRTATVLTGKREELFGSLLWSHTMKSQEVDQQGVKLYPRIDVSLEYVDVSDDPMRQDRFLGRATYAYPLTATVSLPISLSYASDPEFRGDVDKEFSAHLGLSYKLKRKGSGPD